MKIIKNILILAAIASIITLPSCSSSEDDGSTITIGDKLNGTWGISSVRVDGSDVTGDYAGFGITLGNSGSYTINGGYDLLDGSGSYTINGTSTLSISTNRGNSVSVSIELSNDDNSLTFSFLNPTTTFGGGRVYGIAGNHVFELNKK